MEAIVYRFTLDCHKSGIQKTLQGFGTGDSIARKLSISLVAGSNSQAIDADHCEAIMYVTRPGSENPDINACTIENNTVKYTVLKSDISEAGFVTLQMKIIYTNPKTGSEKVIAAPKFYLEVQETEDIDRIIKEGMDSGTFEGSFTALEKAVAKAQAYYHSALMQIEFDEEYVFHAYYADGVEYVNDGMKGLYEECVIIGKQSIESALISKSYAVGETGQREGEELDNARFYKNMAEAALEAVEKNKKIVDEAKDIVLKNSVYANFKVDFATGLVMVESANYQFKINETTGDLEWSQIQ